MGSWVFLGMGQMEKVSEVGISATADASLSILA